MSILPYSALKKAEYQYPGPEMVQAQQKKGKKMFNYKIKKEIETMKLKIELLSENNSKMITTLNQAAKRITELTERQVKSMALLTAFEKIMDEFKEKTENIEKEYIQIIKKWGK